MRHINKGIRVAKYILRQSVSFPSNRILIIENQLMFQKSPPPEADVHSEDELVRHAKKGAVAFKPLYEAYFRRIYLFILYRVGDRDMSSDLTQQTFLNAMVNIHRYEIRGVPFSSWLYRIALNQCNEYFRKTKRARTVVLEDDHLANLADELKPEESMEELMENLPTVLANLDSEDLQVIELRFFDGRPFKEVADILGITENLAKVKTYRILERMKKMFIKKR
jgi:RNA polymerase sigma-70 factor (ECF subfamily)